MASSSVLGPFSSIPVGCRRQQQTLRQAVWRVEKDCRMFRTEMRRKLTRLEQRIEQLTSSRSPRKKRRAPKNWHKQSRAVKRAIGAVLSSQPDEVTRRRRT